MSAPFSPSNGGKMFITPGSGSDAFSTASNISRVLPRQMSTGSTRGTQTVGYGQTKIDGSNNRITLGSGIVLDGDNETISISDSRTDVLTLGKYTDSTFNFRVLDANGIGLAQFGQFPGGLIALKVAQANIEVSTATDSQLTFNSSKSFTIAKSGTFTFPSQSVISGSPVFATSEIIPHGAAYIPAISCFGPIQVGGASFPVYPPDFPTTADTFLANGSLVYQLGLAYMQVYYAVDATNIYLGMGYVNDTGSTVVLLGAPITYYAYTYNAVL